MQTPHVSLLPGVSRVVVVAFAEPGRQGSLRVQEGGHGRTVLRHHLLRARGGGRGHATEGEGGKTLRTEEDVQSGET